MVPVCLRCGDICFEEALVYCFKCEDCALHRYSLDGPVIFTDPVTWFCEDCEIDVIDIDQHDTEIEDSEEVEMDSSQDCVIVKNPQPTSDSIWRVERSFEKLVDKMIRNDLLP